MANPRLILCGGLRLTDAPPRWRRDERLSLELGQGADVHLRLEQLTSRMRAGVPDVALDLLEIAAYVYAADQAFTRGGTTEFDYGDDWRRPFRFVIPVRCPGVWNRADVGCALTEALRFLTDDEYEFEFRQATDPAKSDAYLFDSITPDGTEFAEVVLFSGGLDSLCGAVEEVLVRKRRVVLVSHRSSTRLAARQQDLFEEIRQRLPRRRNPPLHVGVTLNKGVEHNREFTQRSRSFVFAAIAAVIARQVGLPRITFYENGVTSLNLPISPELVGARASRTTHPQSLARFGQLFSLLFDTPFEVANPYLWSTKAEIVRRLCEAGHADLCSRTCSCGHIWGVPEETPHCGRCSQCVDRRVSVLAAGLADVEDPPGRYASNPLEDERDGPELTLVDRYVGMAREIEQIGSVRAFAIRYPEVNDALLYCGGSADQAVERICSLYGRHAAGVWQAVQGVFATRLGDLCRQGFRPRSLLGIVLGRTPVSRPDPEPATKPDGERGFVVDRDRLEVRLDGVTCHLGNTLEFRLAERLHRARGRYLSIEQIGEDVWKDRGVARNCVQAVATNLRRRLREEGLTGVVIDGSQKEHYRLRLPPR